MGDIYISAGSTISVSENAPLMRTADEFGELTYTQIRGVRAVSDLGRVNETFQSRPLYGKPSNVSVGSGVQTLTIELYRGITDAGQNIVRELSGTRFEYSFKVVDAAGVVSYFTATSSQNAAGIANGTAIMDNRITLELTSEVVTA